MVAYAPTAKGAAEPSARRLATGKSHTDPAQVDRNSNSRHPVKHDNIADLAASARLHGARGAYGVHLRSPATPTSRALSCGSDGNGNRTALPVSAAW